MTRTVRDAAVLPTRRASIPVIARHAEPRKGLPYTQFLVADASGPRIGVAREKFLGTARPRQSDRRAIASEADGRGDRRRRNPDAEIRRREFEVRLYEFKADRTLSRARSARSRFDAQGIIASTSEREGDAVLRQEI